MPVHPTYPGVYVEEIPSGVRTITGVATSITAFIGRAPRGPVNQAITITSYTDFERVFGGLWEESTLGYAVRDFYLNGGSQAVIVRLYHPYYLTDADKDAAKNAAKAVSDAADLPTNETPQAVIGAATQKVTSLQLTDGTPVKNAANAVVAAAQAAKDNMDAATKAKARAEQAKVIKQAAQAVAGTAQTVASAVAGADMDQALQAETQKVTDLRLTDGTPAKNAAEAVVAAAQAARDNMDPGITDPARQVEAMKKAAQAVADAAQAVATAAAGATPDEVIAAARSKVTDNLPSLAKEAAQSVLDAANAAIENIDPTITDQAQRADIAKQAAKDAATRVTITKARLTVDTLTLEAASDGAWGNALRARVDTVGVAAAAPGLNLQPGDLFNLTIYDGNSGFTEQFRNVTVKAGARQVDNVLLNGSTLVRAVTLLPVPPQPSDAQLQAEARLADNATATDDDKRKAALAKRVLKQDPFRGDDRDKLSSWVIDAARAPDGRQLTATDDFLPTDAEVYKRGLHALDQVDLFNLLCIPPYQGEKGQLTVDNEVLGEALKYCYDRRAMLIVDSPPEWSSDSTFISTARDKISALPVATSGTYSRNAALFFPRIKQPNPLHDSQMEEFAPCGMMAGIFARTDVQRGVWKAPAGLDAALVGAPQLSVNLTDLENGILNPLGINCLRAFPIYGRVVWGARTLRGADQLGDEYKYIPVRRLALFIEESLYRGTQWVVFEPNDEPLWSQIRLNIGVFMHNLFRQGAFQGKSPREAYFVKCDNETTIQADIDLGIVNIVVGFAPLKPAEFVIIKLQQIAGQLEV